MNFKPFNIHRFTNGDTPYKDYRARGFTAVVEPVAEDERKIRVRMSFCSVKDQYCRKMGVKQALERPVVDQQINARELVHFINAQTLERKCRPMLGNDIFKYLF